MDLEFKSGNFVLCVKDNKTCSLVKYEGAMSRVVEIPASFVYDGVTYPLVEIGHCAFSYNRTVRKVVIPQGVKIISTRPFWECGNLEEIIIPGSVEVICGSAFHGCSRLKSVVVPEGVRKIDYNAFENCKRLEHVELPATLTSLGPGAFRGCEKLSAGLMYNYNHTICFGWMGDLASCPAEIEIDEGVEEIAPSAFEECVPLSKVTLPDSVKKIGEAAFCRCENLTQINVPQSIEKIGRDAFCSCDKLEKKVLCNLAKGLCLGWKGFWEACPTQIVIPEGVTTIVESAFEDCHNLKEVVLPSTLEVIEESAFEECQSLKSLCFPEGLKKIGPRAFKECSQLRSVTFGTLLEEIGYEAFQSCHALMDIVLPSSLKSIGDKCFKACKSLQKINVSDNTEEIGDEVFAGCVQLSQVVTDGLRYAAFGMDDFENTAIVNRSRKKGELFIIDHTVVDGRHCKGVVTIPDGIWEIGEGAFKNCVELTRIHFPSSMKNICCSAFEGCVQLDEVKLPAELPFIAASAFKDCTSLKNLELPNKFDVVYDYAFQNTPWLQNQLKEGEPLILGKTLVDGSRCGGVVHVEGVTTISGGAFRGNTSLSAISVGEGLEYIGIDTFAQCESLERVSLPAGVRTIGAGCFKDCHALESIQIPDGVKIIRRSLFENCSSLRMVQLPSSISGVWSYAFSYCPQLRKPDVPEGAWVSDSAFYRMEDDSHAPKRVTIIPDKNSDYSSWGLHGSVLCVGREAYINRIDLVEVVVPDGVKVICKEAFCYCRNLRKVVLPDSVEIIEDKAFGCTGIVSINFPKNLRVIGKEAFMQTKMKNVVLPEGLASIGEGAFEDSEMVTLRLPSTVTEIGGQAFANCLSLTDATFLSLPNLNHIHSYSFAYREPSGIFRNCARLNRFESPGFPIGEEHFEGTPLLRSVDVWEGDFKIISGCLMETRKNLPEEVEVPDGLLSIAPRAFKNQKRVVKIHLPETLRAIGEEAFKGCSHLEEINLPEGLVSIGEGLFSECGFKRFDWPAHLTRLPSRTFENSSSLRELVLPETLESLSWDVLTGCELQTLIILNEACQFDSLVVQCLSDNAMCILWRGDISSISAPYSVGRFCMDNETREGHIRLLNHYTRGLELGFDYGDKCVERNDRMIRYFVTEKPSSTPFKIKCCEILNTILHILFFPFIFFAEMGHMGSPNHQPSYFLDDTLTEMYMERSRKGFMEYASESMVRYLKRNDLWQSAESEDAKG